MPPLERQEFRLRPPPHQVRCREHRQEIPGQALDDLLGVGDEREQLVGLGLDGDLVREAHRQTIVYPPLTDSVWPVTYDARSEASSSTGPTMSSGVPRRRSG